MTNSARWLLSILGLFALTLTACGSAQNGAGSAGPEKPGEAQVQGSAAETTVSDKPNMSAQTPTIHQLSMELVNLMDDVSNKKIMNPPLKVSDVRNAFMERLTWIDDMSAEDVTEMRKATADLDALVAEIRAHENAAGDVVLEARLKKIEDWNRSIKEAIPQ